MLVQSAFRSQLFLSVLAHSSVSVVDDGEDAHLSRNYSFLRFLNPFTPIGDQDRISPYNIMQTSDENKYKYQSGDYYSIQNQIPYRGKEGAALNHYQF